MSKIDVVIGALVASLILFVSNMVTLFTENPELTLEMVKQSTWISIGGGALVAFLKDYQARSFRRVVSKATKSGQVHAMAPWLATGLAILLIGGCGVTHPKVDSVSDGIVVAAANIETAATELRALCGNTVRNGECVPGAPVSTQSKNRLRDQLQDAQDNLVLANAALSAGDAVDADDRLGRAEAILLVIQSILRERAQ